MPTTDAAIAMRFMIDASELAVSWMHWRIAASGAVAIGRGTGRRGAFRRQSSTPTSNTTTLYLPSLPLGRFGLFTALASVAWAAYAIGLGR